MITIQLFRRFALIVLVLAVGLFVPRATQAQGALGNDAVQSAEVVVSAASALTPWDSTPSPDAKMIYFTAAGGKSGPGVFSVAATGGAVKVLAVGAPLIMPLGIAVSSDGKTLYVADPMAAGPGGNVIYTLPVEGGTPKPIDSTRGTMPHGLEVIEEKGADQVYFSGKNPDTGQPAILKIAAAGGKVQVVASGTPLVDPSGVAIAQDGTVYVLDRLASGKGLGAVIRIKNQKAEIIAKDVRTGGELAGITLTHDDSLVLVSSLDTKKGTAQVLLIDPKTLQTGIVNKVIGESTAAGGLHRAFKGPDKVSRGTTTALMKPYFSSHREMFSWADSKDGGGRVFVVKTPAK